MTDSPSFSGQRDSLPLRTVSTVIIFILIIFFGLGFMDFQRRRERINQSALFEVESHVKLTASRVNTGLSRADSLVRHVLDKLQASSLSVPVLSGSEFDRYLRRELLLTPDVRFLSIIRADNKTLWLSPGISREDQGFDSDLDLHRKTGVRFLLKHHVNPALPQAEHIHLSRSFRDPDGNLLAVVDAILDTDTLLPFLDDPFFRHSLEMRLLDDELNTILLRTFPDRVTDSGEWLAGLMDQIRESSIRGGLHVITGDWWAAGIYQVESFPYYCMAVISMEDELEAWQAEIVQAISFLLAVGILVWLIAIAVLQLIRNRRIREHFNKLEEVNKELVKTSEERKLLVREVHHRVKNNLVLISSIINLVVLRKGPYNEETLKDLGSRIEAIQRVHDSLYSGDSPSQVSVKEYLKGLVESIVSSLCSFEVFVLIDVEDFFLKPHQIIPLGVICAEVVTNAVKYGLVPGGSLRVKGGIFEKKDVTICFCNDGRPYREAPAGLGSLLIQALTEQLHGTFIREKGPDTCFRLSFPLEDEGD